MTNSQNPSANFSGAQGGSANVRFPTDTEHNSSQPSGLELNRKIDYFQYEHSDNEREENPTYGQELLTGGERDSLGTEVTKVGRYDAEQRIFHDTRQHITQTHGSTSDNLGTIVHDDFRNIEIDSNNLRLNQQTQSQ